MDVRSRPKEAPLTVLRLAELLHESGLPAGALQAEGGAVRASISTKITLSVQNPKVYGRYFYLHIRVLFPASQKKDPTSWSPALKSCNPGLRSFLEKARAVSSTEPPELRFHPKKSLMMDVEA